MVKEHLGVFGAESNCRVYMHRHINTNGIELIKRYEGFSSAPYKCAAGHLTIGYGHKITNNEKFECLTKWQAENLLAQDLYKSELAVAKYIDNNLSDNQFAAIVSFTFNLGAASLQRSTLRQKANFGLYKECGDEFLKWIYIGTRKLPGLIRRRIAERLLFLEGIIM